MDVLVTFIIKNEPEITNPIKFINDRWQSTYHYWINANRNTALDEDWVITTISQPVANQPQNMKLVYKMFIFCNVIKTEVCHLPKENHSKLPQYNTIFARLK